MNEIDDKMINVAMSMNRLGKSLAKINGLANQLASSVISFVLPKRDSTTGLTITQCRLDKIEQSINEAIITISTQESALDELRKLVGDEAYTIGDAIATYCEDKNQPLTQSVEYFCAYYKKFSYPPPWLREYLEAEGFYNGDNK